MTVLPGGSIISGSSGLLNVVDDITPQLGGVLDTNGSTINESEAPPVASATVTDIWGDLGNTMHITGTVTITRFRDPPNVGAWCTLIFDDILTIENGPNTNMPGGTDFITAPGDVAFVYGETASKCMVLLFKASGGPVVAAGASAGVFTGSFKSSDQDISAGGSLTLPHGLPSTPTLIQPFLKNVDAVQGYSVGDIIPISPGADQSINAGLSIVSDATNINIRFGSADNNFTIVNKLTGVRPVIERIQWKLIIRAYSE